MMQYRAIVTMEGTQGIGMAPVSMTFSDL